MYINKIFIKIYEKENSGKSIKKLTLEILSQIILTSLIFYILKNVLEYILLLIPIKKINGYDYKRTATYGLSSIGVFLFMFQNDFNTKLTYYKNEVSSKY